MRNHMNIIHKLVCITIILNFLSAINAEEKIVDHWSPWRETATYRTLAEFSTGNILYQCDFSKEKEPGILTKTPLNIVNENGVCVLRILPGTPLPRFSVPVKGMNADEWQNGFEFSFRFRIGDVKNKIRSGQGTLIGLRFSGPKTATVFRIQTAYLKGGIWYFNGLGMRDHDKITTFQKTFFATGPAGGTSGPGIDLKWHEVKIQTKPKCFQIIWDGLPVFRAEDPRLDLNNIAMEFYDPTNLLGYLDIANITVKEYQGK